MGLDIRLDIKMSQQLVMTPQLQQAIKLLQLSSLELQQEIQQALCTNPLLELADEIAPEETETAETEAPDTNTVDESWNQEIPEELPVDARWEDIYQTTAASAAVRKPVPEPTSRTRNRPSDGVPRRISVASACRQNKCTTGFDIVTVL